MQVKVLLTLMTPRPFKKLLGYCMKRHASNKKRGPLQYSKTSGKLHPSVLAHIKYKISNLFNFAWKPEDIPVVGGTKEKVSCREVPVNSVKGSV